MAGAAARKYSKKFEMNTSVSRGAPVASVAASATTRFPSGCQNGAKFAAPDRPCVSVCGDGAFFMHANVLGTAVEYDLPVVWVVWNNYAYASIRGLQRGYLGGREDADVFIQDMENVGSRFTADKITYKIRGTFGVAAIDYRSFSRGNV